MFSCACYPANKEFLQNVAQETIFQVRYKENIFFLCVNMKRRLSNHPCIALWCGNNENEEGLGWYDEVVKQNRDRYVVDYTKLYIDTIYEILLQVQIKNIFFPCVYIFHKGRPTKSILAFVSFKWNTRMGSF